MSDNATAAAAAAGEAAAAAAEAAEAAAAEHADIAGAAGDAERAALAAEAAQTAAAVTVAVADGAAALAEQKAAAAVAEVTGEVDEWREFQQQISSRAAALEMGQETILAQLAGIQAALLILTPQPQPAETAVTAEEVTIVEPSAEGAAGAPQEAAPENQKRGRYRLI